MNINKKIIDTVAPFVQGVFPNRNLVGEQEIYCVFEYLNQEGVSFADDFPSEEVAFIQLHLFCPARINYKSLMSDIRKALYQQDFTFPTITEMFENDTEYNHIVFAFEYSVSVDY